MGKKGKNKKKKIERNQRSHQVEEEMLRDNGLLKDIGISGVSRIIGSGLALTPLYLPAPAVKRIRSPDNDRKYIRSNIGEKFLG